MGGIGCKVKIMHASLFVRKVKLTSSIFLAHAKTLERGTAKYPIRRVVCKAFTIPEHYLDVSHEKLFSGQLPTRIVIGLVSNRAFRIATLKFIYYNVAMTFILIIVIIIIHRSFNC